MYVDTYRILVVANKLVETHGHTSDLLTVSSFTGLLVSTATRKITNSSQHVDTRKR